MKKYSKLDNAINFASTVHSGQFTRDGLPYILHPLHVMNNVSLRYGSMLEDLLCIAILHDTIEDCYDVTETELKELFGPIITASVVALTKLPGEPLHDYIERVTSDPYAAAVKMADIEHNSLMYRDASIKKLAEYREVYDACKHYLSKEYLWYQDRAGLL